MNWTRTLVCLIFGLLVTAHGAQAQNVKSDQEVLIELEREWDAAFHSQNAAFIELNVASDPAYRDQMYDRAGHGSTFPQIFIGATHVGGCDELYALDRVGKLDALLAGEKASS